MARCGCAGTCTCAFASGRGIQVTGSGSQGDPILVEIDGGQAYVRGGVTDSVLVNLSGAGTLDSPYVVAMDMLDDAEPSLVAYRFTAPGTYSWTKPAFGTLALIDVVAAGGGGAGAGGTNEVTSGSSTAVQFASGGRPGQFSHFERFLADITGAMTIVIGAGGTGGPGSAEASLGTYTPGTAGTAGGNSSFDTFLALGGAGGFLTAQGASDIRSVALESEGGTGGLGVASANPDPEPYRIGLDGGAPLGSPAIGGVGYSLIDGSSGGAGGNWPGLRPAAGTGGGGGLGVIINSGAYGGGDGGLGGVGAGGGGGGVGQPRGGAGGRGGHGIVQIIIQ